MPTEDDLLHSKSTFFVSRFVIAFLDMLQVLIIARLTIFGYRTLKTIAFPDVFVTPFSSKAYEESNLQKWADKGISGCRAVVGADRRKWGHFSIAVSLYQSFCLR